MGQSWTKAHDSSKNTFWENYPSIASPIIDTELNRNEVSVDTVDDRVITLDTTKAEQSDLLLAFKSVSLDETTGIITFTKFNNTTATIDTSLEKIATNFRYIDDPTDPHYQYLELTLVDGSKQYVDLRALLNQYEFTDSSTIDFSVDSSGNVTAIVIDGSITESKLQPNFLADCRSAKAGAESAEADAIAKALVSEGYANGKQNGVPVTSGSPYYENNAEYFKDQAQSIVGSKVDSFNGRTGVVTSQSGDYTQDQIGVPTGASVGQVPTVASVGGSLVFSMETASKGLLPHFIITSDTGSTVTATKGTETQTATETSTGVFEVDVEGYGTYTITSVLNGDTITDTITVDDVKIYTLTMIHFSASITVTYPSGATVICTDGITTLTATSSPYEFSIGNAGTWEVKMTYNSITKTEATHNVTNGSTFTDNLTFSKTSLAGVKRMLNYHAESLLAVGDSLNVTVSNATKGVKIGRINTSSHYVDFVADAIYATGQLIDNNLWSGQTLKTTANNFYANMATADKNCVTQVTRQSKKASGNELESYTAYAWVPNAGEVFGGSYCTIASYNPAITQMPIFTTQANRIRKYNGNNYSWLCCDIKEYSDSKWQWYCTYTNGAQSNIGTGSTGGVLPCFRVKAD